MTGTGHGGKRPKPGAREAGPPAAAQGGSAAGAGPAHEVEPLRQEGTGREGAPAVCNPHADCVGLWLQRLPPGLSSEDLLERFLEAFRSVWRRAAQALGRPTMHAVLGRVLDHAAISQPLVALFTASPDGLDDWKLREAAHHLQGPSFLAAMQAILETLLSVLGELTSEALTPALQAVLCPAKAGAPRESAGMPPTPIDRVHTGVRNLDPVMGGGVPVGSLVVIGGSSGTGKTILAQQIAFYNASPEQPVLYITTLGESAAKILRFMTEFSFCDQEKLHTAVHVIDISGGLRDRALADILGTLLDHVRRIKPAILVIDSARVFENMARSAAELRHFTSDLAVAVSAWEVTTFLLGEYGPVDFRTSPVFSIVDGIILLSLREVSGEMQRFMQVVKLRGTAHSTAEHTFAISGDGINLYASRVVIQRQYGHEGALAERPRLKTGIGGLDDLLGDGITPGASILVGGATGTGKTITLLAFICQGASKYGEKGLYVSFEETPERLILSAGNVGLDLERHLASGQVEILFVPQPEIQVDAQLLLIQDRVASLGARRVAIDSLSVFLNRLVDPAIKQDKVFQLATIVQNAEAVAFLAAETDFGSDAGGLHGYAGSIFDGVILLTAPHAGNKRRRFVEVYKLRYAAHRSGAFPLTIGPGGIMLAQPKAGPLPPAAEAA